MHSRCIPCRLHVGMGTARWAPRSPGRSASKQTQHTSSCSTCRRGGVAGGVSSSRVGVNDIPPLRTGFVDGLLAAAAGRYRKRRVRRTTHVRRMRFLTACGWLGNCGGGTLYKVTSPLRDAPPRFVRTAPGAECVVKWRVFLCVCFFFWGGVFKSVGVGRELRRRDTIESDESATRRTSEGWDF